MCWSLTLVESEKKNAIKLVRNRKPSQKVFLTFPTNVRIIWKEKKTAAAPTTREQEKLDKWHLLGTKAMDRWGWFAPSTKKQQYEMVSECCCIWDVSII